MGFVLIVTPDFTDIGLTSYCLPFKSHSNLAFTKGGKLCRFGAAGIGNYN